MELPLCGMEGLGATHCCLRCAHQLWSKSYAEPSLATRALVPGLFTCGTGVTLSPTCWQCLLCRPMSTIMFTTSVIYVQSQSAFETASNLQLLEITALSSYLQWVTMSDWEGDRCQIKAESCWMLLSQCLIIKAKLNCRALLQLQ